MDDTTEGLTARAESRFSSDLNDLINIRAFLRGFCKDSFVPPPPLDKMDQLELAVDEAASNVMRHAYAGQPDGWLHLIAEADSSTIFIRLLHGGKPFDQEKVRPPAFDGTREGGFGVYLIAQSVDQVQYSTDEQGVNCIAFVKKFGESGQ
ncbi:MAG: ATP-binding protein [Armatimonadota bacterium]|nr:ATP-binding protein [Armatimonadota bacterium]